MARVIPILINVRADGIDVNPTQVYVQRGDQDVKFRWTVVGGTFPGSACFSWKSSPSGAPSVTCPSSGAMNVLESATYKNEASSNFGVWGYTLNVVVDTSTGTQTIPIDPEVNNEPPSGML